MSSFSIINPYCNKIIETHPHESHHQICEKISHLNNGFDYWKKTSEKQKKATLNQLAIELEKEKNTIAMLISTDMGKPITESINEVKKCIDCCEFYKQKIKPIQKAMQTPHGIREPLGVIFGIMPWNYPLWQIIRFIIPTLITGNTCLIKPAPNTFRIAQLLQDCIHASDDRITSICIPPNNEIASIIKHPGIAGVSFTGSLETGKSVGSLATQCLKPCVLELGGSDPFIVFEDANLDTAIAHAIKSRFTNAGQVCISAKRFLFEESIYKDAKKELEKKATQFIVYGDPTNPKTTLGPLARIDIKNNLESQIKRAKISANHVIYHHSIDHPYGNAMPPMIIDGTTLDKTNPLFTEEVFGPIAICNTFKTTEEAIEKANATPYGLGASIWTENTTIISECTQKIDCGTLAINTPLHSRFDTPFGGRKQSGLGLELGMEGALSFTGFKAIMRSPGTTPR